MQEEVNHTAESHIVMSQLAMRSLEILRKADFSESQSRAQVRAMLVTLNAGVKHFDQGLKKLKTELKAEMDLRFNAVEEKMDLRFKTVEKNAEVRYEALKNDSKRSNMIMIIGFTGLILTVVFSTVAIVLKPFL